VVVSEGLMQEGLDGVMQHGVKEYQITTVRPTGKGIRWSIALFPSSIYGAAPQIMPKLFVRPLTERELCKMEWGKD